MLQASAEHLAPAIHAVWAKAASLGTLPPQWQEVRMVAIFKKGAEDDMGNYRPIAVPSAYRRIVEATILAKALAKWAPHPLQFGFRPKVEADMAIVHLHAHCVAQEQTIVLLDAQKAFDTVNRVTALHRVAQALGALSDEIAPFLGVTRMRMGRPDGIWVEAVATRGVPQGRSYRH